jgi:DNA polymerase III subunit delta
LKLAPARIAGFLARPDPGLRAALIYGPDTGLVRERGDRLAAAICADPKDAAFCVAELAAATLAGDPARLRDEAASLSLIGGRRLVRVRDAGDAVATLFRGFFADLPAGDSFVLIEAGELTSRSTLRRAFESAASAVAIACYPDTKRDLEALAREVLGAHRVTASGEALAYLTSHLGGDRLLSRGELEKLALYVGDGGAADLEAARAAVGDSASLSLEDVVLSAADGDAAALERALDRAFGEGEMPVTVLRALMRHFQRLHLAASRVAGGMSEAEALQSLRPPVFFKVQERLIRQLPMWPERRAAQALDVLLEAELNAKRTGLPADAVCRDALMRIARNAGARARRG